MTGGPAMAAVLLVAGAASVPLLWFGGDAWLADRLFELQGGSWLARDAWWSAALLHVGGRRASILGWLLVLAAFALTWTPHVAREWRRPLAYFLGTTAVAMLLVSTLKARTGIDCPWDLVRYGGTRPMLAPFVPRPAALGAAACFPAAHASAGYLWVAAYFALAAVRPQWRHVGLACGLLLGLAFGVTQQVRGAHFLSHDIWALTTCWLTAALSARLWLPVRLRQAAASREGVPATRITADASTRWPAHRSLPQGLPR